MKAYLVYLLTALLLVGRVVSAQDNDMVTVVAHDSFNVSEHILAAFEEESGLTVQILRAGDAGTMLNQAILSKNNPLGDLIFGVDNTFLGRALEEEIFEPYESPMLEVVSDEFLMDTGFLVTPIDFGDVCLNYDVAYFDDNDLPLPENLSDLTDPLYEGLLVVQNPASSSPGLAFLMATIAEFGNDSDYTYLDYWADLTANETLIVSDWSTAYFTEFTAGGGGTYPLVVSYASSPPFTFDEELDDVTTGSIVADGTCFRQIEFAGVLAGASNPDGAQAFIDFMLGEAFQEDVPLQMFVFPVNVNAELPELFAEYASIPENPATLPFEEINANREEWIQAWTENVLR